MLGTDSEKYKLIAKYFGKISASADGQNLSVYCPFCDSKDYKKKKLTFRTSDGANHCWVCDWRSGAPHRAFIAAGMGGQALQECESVYGPARAHYTPPKALLQQVAEEAAAGMALPAGFQLLDRLLDSQSSIVQKCISYLQGRGLTLADFKRCRLGISSDPEFYGRVIMPSFGPDGNVNYFTGRSAIGSNFKYMNASTRRNLIVFNELDVDFNKELLLVEGPFDWAACQGINTVSMLGSTVHEDSLLFHRIISAPTPRVVLGFDPDANRKRNRVASAFQAFGVEVRFLTFPAGTDPASLGNKAMKEIYGSGQQEFDLKTRIFDLAMPRLLR